MGQQLQSAMTRYYKKGNKPNLTILTSFAGSWTTNMVLLGTSKLRTFSMNVDLFFLLEVILFEVKGLV